jgi:hypothetical protein
MPWRTLAVTVQSSSNARQLLTERDPRAFVDEHLAQSAHEIEAQLCLALALDGAAPEHTLGHQSALDGMRDDEDGRQGSAYGRRRRSQLRLRA